MTRKCIVNKCSSRHTTKGVHFFRFPSVTSKKTVELSKQRVREWLKVLGFRDSYDPKDKYICSLHFTSGKAARISDVTNVDWIPTIGIVKINSEIPADRNELLVDDTGIITSQSFESFEGALLEASHLNSTVLPPKPAVENGIPDCNDHFLCFPQCDNAVAEAFYEPIEEYDHLIVDQDDYESFVKSILEEANLVSTGLQNDSEDSVTFNVEDTEENKPVEKDMHISVSRNNIVLTSFSESNDGGCCVREHNYCKSEQSQCSSNLHSTSTPHSIDDSAGAVEVTAHSSQGYSHPTNTTNALDDEQDKRNYKDEIIKAYQKELARLQKRVGALEEEISKNHYDLRWINDDRRCKLFTGISSLRTLKIIFSYVENCLFQPVCTLSRDQMFVMTLRKLRRNTPFVDLAEEYSVCTTTISKYFHRTLFVIYGALKYALDPVSKEISIRHLPRIFLEIYGPRRIHIIDCFEVATEEPTDPKAALSHHSSYKMRETTKFLIAMSADGRVSFISNAYAGRCSDRKIAETSGFLDTLEAGDVVIADKGFDVSDLIASKGATLNIPTFLRKDSQLNPLHLEKDKQITTLRVHIERLIGVLKSKYEYLNGLILVDSLRRFENNVNAVDLAVWVCCILVNFNISIV